MEVRLRKTRTLKVTEVEIPSEERELLAQLFPDPRYEALLNLMERACISLETAHFNTGVNDPEGILGGHALTKGAWLFFLFVQGAVNNAYHTRTMDEPESQPASLNDLIQGVEPIEEFEAQ